MLLADYKDNNFNLKNNNNHVCELIKSQAVSLFYVSVRVFKRLFKICLIFVWIGCIILTTIKDDAKFVERKVRYSALFTNLVVWHMSAVSFPQVTSFWRS